MISVEERIVINVPADEAWAKMRDLTAAKYYIPGVTDIEIISDNKECNGTVRKATSQAKPYWTHETVDRWLDGQGFRLRLHKDEKPTYPFAREFYFIYAMEDKRGVTLFRPRIEYKLSPLFYLFAPLVKKGMRGILKQITVAMKEYYETGTPITPKRQSEIKQQLKKA